MKMNAMESLKDPSMLYLDLVAGFGGCVLFAVLQKGAKNVSVKTFTKAPVSMYVDMLFSTVLVLISRVIVDYSYYNLKSKTEYFGGSNEEFLYSSLVWLTLMSIYKKLMYPKKCMGMLMKEVVLQYLSTFLVMLATARVTGWG